MTREAGIDESGGGVREQAEPAQRGLALESPRDVVGESHDLVRRSKHELARMQDEGLIRTHLDELGEVGLLLSGIDVRVAVVLEDAEVAIKSHIDARRLDHPRVVGVQPHSPSIEFGTQVAVGEQHDREAIGPPAQSSSNLSSASSVSRSNASIWAPT